MGRTQHDFQRGRTTKAGTQCWLCQCVAGVGVKFTSAGRDKSSKMVLRFKAFRCVVERLDGPDGGWVVDGCKWSDARCKLCYDCLDAPMEALEDGALRPLDEDHLQRVTAARKSRGQQTEPASVATPPKPQPAAVDSPARATDERSRHRSALPAAASPPPAPLLVHSLSGAFGDALLCAMADLTVSNMRAFCSVDHDKKLALLRASNTRVIALFSEQECRHQHVPLCGADRCRHPFAGDERQPHRLRGVPDRHLPRVPDLSDGLPVRDADSRRHVVSRFGATA